METKRTKRPRSQSPSAMLDLDAEGGNIYPTTTGSIPPNKKKKNSKKKRNKQRNNGSSSITNNNNSGGGDGNAQHSSDEMNMGGGTTSMDGFGGSSSFDAALSKHQHKSSHHHKETATAEGNIMSQMLSTFSNIEQSRFQAYRRVTFRADIVQDWIASCLTYRYNVAMYSSALPLITAHQNNINNYGNINNNNNNNNNNNTNTSNGRYKSFFYDNIYWNTASRQNQKQHQRLRLNKRKRFLQHHQQQEQGGTCDREFDRIETSTSSTIIPWRESPYYRPLLDLVLPGQHEDIGLVVTVAAKIYAQRLVKAAVAYQKLEQERELALALQKQKQKEQQQPSGDSTNNKTPTPTTLQQQQQQNQLQQQPLRPLSIWNVMLDRQRRGVDPGFFLQPNQGINIAASAMEQPAYQEQQRLAALSAQDEYDKWLKRVKELEEEEEKEMFQQQEEENKVDTIENNEEMEDNEDVIENEDTCRNEDMILESEADTNKEEQGLQVGEVHVPETTEQEMHKKSKLKDLIKGIDDDNEPKGVMMMSLTHNNDATEEEEEEEGQIEEGEEEQNRNRQAVDDKEEAEVGKIVVEVSTELMDDVNNLDLTGGDDLIDDFFDVAFGLGSGDGQDVDLDDEFPLS